MSLQISKRTVQNIFIYVLLFLCSMNFQAKFHYFVYALFIILIISQKNYLFINNKSLVYLALCVLMSLYSAKEGLLSMLRCFSSFMMYVVGFNLTVKNDQFINEEKESGFSGEYFVYTLIVLISVGSFSHYMLNAITNFGVEIGRNTIDVWSGEIMAATGQSCLACLMLGLSIAIIFKPLKKYQKNLGFACIFVALAYNFVLSGRLIIAVLFVLIFVCLIYISKVEKSVSKKVSLAIKVMAFAFAIWLVFLLNIGGIQDFLMESNFVERFTEVLDFWDNSDRNNAKLQFILNGWKHPFGGLHLRMEYGYAHDLLLDGYDEFGFGGFILLLGVLLNGLYSFYKLLMSSRYSHEFKLVLLCVYVSILIVFCIEPILAGTAWLFTLFCFINGCMDGMRNSRR